MSETGVYSKAEDAIELKAKLDDDNWPASIVEESLAALTHRLYPLNELIEATKEVLRISDRNHEAWTRCHAAIKALEK
jgi:hypothetical protein